MKLISGHEYANALVELRCLVYRPFFVIAARSSVKDLSEYGRVTGEYICIVAEVEKNTKSDENDPAVPSYSYVWFWWL